MRRIALRLMRPTALAFARHSRESGNPAFARTERKRLMRRIALRLMRPTALNCILMRPLASNLGHICLRDDKYCRRANG